MNDRQPLDEVFILRDGPSAFSGITHDGTVLHVEGQMSLQHARPRGSEIGVSYLCFAGRLKAEAPSVHSEPPISVVFAVANLAFTGDTGTVYEGPAGSSRFYRDTVQFVLGDTHLTLTKLGNYDEILRHIRANEGMAVTAMLRIPVAPGRQMGDVEKIARRVCALLTIATGNLVTWLSWRLTNSAGDIVEQERRTPITRKMAGSGVIDAREPRELKGFLEAAYPRFIELEERLQLHRVAHALVDGLTGSFLQTRALAMGVLTEYLVGQYLADADVQIRILASRAGARVLRRHLIEQMRTRLTEVVKEFAPELPPLAVGEIGAAFENKLAWLNEPTLNHKLTELVRRTSANLTEDDIRRFVRTRNELAHRMDFCDDSKPAVEYFHMRYVVEQLLMAILGYVGPFVDCRSWTRNPGRAVNAPSG